MKKILLYAATLGAAFSVVSCTQEIILDNIDESAYDNVLSLKGTLRDANTNRTSNIVEIFDEAYDTDVRFNLARTPKEGVEVNIKYDESYLDAYNAEHNTTFALYPQDRMELQNEGRIVVAPDEKKSFDLNLRLNPLGLEGFEQGKTYLLPLKAEVKAGETLASEIHLVYLVKNCAGQASIRRTPDQKKVFCFLEVNDTNPLNVLQWKTEDGVLLTDFVVFFAYNINYDRIAGEVFLNPNDQCKYILEHADKIIKPLHDAGVKVIMGLLGNHDESGLAQLSPIGCKQFATKLAAICNAYGFDGLNFDDEYSENPDLSNPLFCDRSNEAGARLMLECKKAMPDKYITSFQYGSMWGVDNIDGYIAADYIDIAVANYYQPASPMLGMSMSDCSAYSVELARGGSISVNDAKEWGASDYGYVMIFAPWAANNQGTQPQWTSLSNLSEGLYGKPLARPEFYYPETRSLDTKPINW